jgi:phosphoribosyl-dephospho-CoA transferase
MTPHRHDRAWLVPGFDPGPQLADALQSAAVRDWIRRGRPFVIARRDGASVACVRLGLALPGRAPRVRIALTAAAADIERFAPALPLAEALAAAPVAWRSRMLAVAALAARCGATPRVYGSLAFEFASGEPYVDADSDLDLLFEVDDDAAVGELLAGLRELRDGPRIDGELRFAGGWAVAWRELDLARRPGGALTVLAKCDHAVRLLPVAQLREPAPVN